MPLGRPKTIFENFAFFRPSGYHIDKNSEHFGNWTFKYFWFCRWRIARTLCNTPKLQAHPLEMLFTSFPTHLIPSPNSSWAPRYESRKINTFQQNPVIRPVVHCHTASNSHQSDPTAHPPISLYLDAQTSDCQNFGCFVKLRCSTLHLWLSIKYILILWPSLTLIPDHMIFLMWDNLRKSHFGVRGTEKLKISKICSGSHQKVPWASSIPNIRSWVHPWEKARNKNHFCCRC